MPSAFRPEEQRSIRTALLAAARRSAETTGMKNVTVENITREAGISKGAFYRFYETKELLFLDMMEEFFRHLGEHLAERKKSLPEQAPELTSEKLLLEGLRSVTSPALSRFFSEDAPALFRKLTPEQKAAHFASTEEYLRRLLLGNGIRLNVPEPAAVSAIQLLLSCAAQNTGRTNAVDILSESLSRYLVRGA